MLSFSAIDHSNKVSDNFILVRKVISGLVVDLKYFDNDNFVAEWIVGYEENQFILTFEASTPLCLECFITAIACIHI